VFEAAIWVKLMCMTKKIENMEINFYLNFHLKDGVGMEFAACYGELMPEGALTSFTICE